MERPRSVVFYLALSWVLEHFLDLSKVLVEVKPTLPSLEEQKTVVSNRSKLLALIFGKGLDAFEREVEDRLELELLYLDLVLKLLVLGLG